MINLVCDRLRMISKNVEAYSLSKVWNRSHTRACNTARACKEMSKGESENYTLKWDLIDHSFLWKSLDLSKKILRRLEIELKIQ